MIRWGAFNVDFDRLLSYFFCDRIEVNLFKKK